MDKKNLIKLLVAAIIVVIVLRMISRRKSTESYEDFDEYAMMQETLAPVDDSTTPTPTMLPGQVPMMSGAPMAASVDLLPKQAAASQDYSEFAPRALGEQNFLDASKFIGVDTQGSSLRNANYSLRADPPIVRKDVGIWNGSSIEADLFRRKLDC